MEMHESFSKASMRRKYRRLETESGGGGGIVVQPRRVKVVHLAGAGGLLRSSDHRRRPRPRLELQCFRLVPERLMGIVRAAAVKVIQAGSCTSRDAIAAYTPQPILLLPRTHPLRSSTNDVIDEVWFQNALRRSIVDGRVNI